MDKTWKWKVWGILGSIIISVYALVPTLFNFPKLRQELESQERYLPWHLKFFPEKGLNLGLDLRGGIYVEMDVLIDDGMQAKLDLLAQDIERDLKRRKLEPTSWKQDAKHTFLTFVFKTGEELQASLRYIERNYSDLFQKSETSGADNATLHLILDKQYNNQLRQDILSQAVQAVRNRIDRYGLAEPTVQRQGETRLVVELPGVKDPERALSIIKQAGKLEFKLVNSTLQATTLGNMIADARKENNLAIGHSAEDVERLNELLKSKLPEDTEIAFEITRDTATGKVTQATPYLLNRTAYVTGEMLKDAQVQFDSRTSEPYVSLTFNSAGAKNFADLTTAHVKEYLAIMLDGNVASAPIIQEPIRNGQCRITLGANLSREQTLKEAKDLVLVLQEGALPARLKELTKSVIGPTLGKDSIQKSLKSILVGAFIVIIFMVIYYNLSGLLANMALLLNTLFIFALLAMFQATLTLPGMAGIVLTIGMAVDANILIFERIREELKAGQAPREAVAAGYKNAVRTIMDSNLTTIIAGIVLYQFGTGPIRGFAVTLIIGLICNMFTSIIVTRTVYDFFTLKRKVKKIYV